MNDGLFNGGGMRGVGIFLTFVAFLGVFLSIFPEVGPVIPHADNLVGYASSAGVTTTYSLMYFDEEGLYDVRWNTPEEWF